MQAKRSSSSRFLGLIVGLVLLAAATLAAQDVRYNYMPGTDFSKYHSYKWVAIQGGAHPNQIMDAQIKEAVDRQLASKGLMRRTGIRLIFMWGTRWPWIRRNS